MSASNTAESEYASREAQLLESYRPDPAVFDELNSDRRRRSAALAQRARSVCRDGRGCDQGRARQGAAAAARKRRYVRCARRTRQQPAVAARFVSAAHRPGGMDGDRARRDAAGTAPERVAGRSLRRAARAQRKGAATRSRIRQLTVPAAVRERFCPRQSAFALRRVRSRALGRRPLVGAQRPHAGAFGCGLRARESRRVVAVSARHVRGAQRTPARELLSFVQPAVPESRESRYASRRVPVARAGDAKLLRARIPRSLPRFQRSRRLRPYGA